ncbi:arginine--tRNA ligase [Tenacibaculum maritimum]|uniref:arginine--tRNA ligase n=1 Tax=Tenacibaculum maritimum TaxID=107401 RepID=UPI0004062032|nr:arginine--tRNA ligase [Tenacibaculum maritimum]MCD9621906.1 arginine--tRNA ligase [Tenacibaculum maritimum]MCD9628428.1 arginine--tRNA ligase [Tenacibaculum maritimum]MCD9631172.1 arginine--tRNA ligase [Tenacibaculum maritimum]MCD9633037.1 arginine--tRNA ligase [Tenacibaculum maritimum]CAA0162873.1 Arginine--tRNA ligase [Tenacibaculum maritimum]
MNIQNLIETKVKEGFLSLYQVAIPSVEFQATRKEFEGDITVVVFPLLRYKKGNPVQIGEDLGNYLVAAIPEVTNYNVVKGFLNLVIDDRFYTDFFNSIHTNVNYGLQATAKNEQAMLVEYSSPNTNKPLHLGHVRNVLLGYSVSEIIKASGKKVYKTQIINDRGIHICKSMLAWQKFGHGATPESTGLKGDKLVGNYYVKFDQEYKKEIADLIAHGHPEETAKKEAPLFLEAQEMLRKWEAGDKEVVALWEMMNGWVYTGFDVTYKNIGVDFDKLYYESNTYLLGKDIIEEGLSSGVFYKKEDGSVWCDLTSDGLDEKLVLRSDGTAVYMTQDIGTAVQRSKDMPDVNGMVYTVGNEQDYHFKVLFLILKKLGYSWAEQLYHLSYGMVDLPSGKMKSREGTVVDADDLMDEMTGTARSISQELGKLEGYSEEEKEKLYKIIGLGALKYFILKVDPKKRILFDPKASVDFQGNTGPFIQYTYARIQSILRKATFDYSKECTVALHEKEKELIKQLTLYPETIQLAAANYSPALIANYTYELVKEFNSFYQNVSILGEEDQNKKIFRVQLAKKVADTIKSAFSLLGIQVPERM